MTNQGSKIALQYLTIHFQLLGSSPSFQNNVKDTSLLTTQDLKTRTLPIIINNPSSNTPNYTHTHTHLNTQLSSSFNIHFCNVFYVPCVQLHTYICSCLDIIHNAEQLRRPPKTEQFCVSDVTMLSILNILACHMLLISSKNPFELVWQSNPIAKWSYFLPKFTQCIWFHRFYKVVSLLF